MPRRDQDLSAASVLSHLGVMLGVSALTGLLVAGLALPFVAVAGMGAQGVTRSLEDLPEDVLRDASISDPNNTPFLPEHRDHPDDNISLEERLVATPGEDPLSAGAEIGINEELDMEDLNQTDNIEGAWEDARFGMDDAMDGNERRGGLEKD